MTDVLAEYENLKVRDKAHIKTINDLHDSILVKDTIITELRQLKIYRNNLNDREKTLDKRELKLSETILQKDVECANRKSDIVLECFDKVFKNPITRREVLKNGNNNTYDQSTGQTKSDNAYENTSETISEE